MEEEKKEDNQERKDGKKEEGRSLNFRIDDDITEEEYDRAIKEIKEKSAPRKDNIDYKMIKEPLNCFKVEMIKIFNNI